MKNIKGNTEKWHHFNGD